MEAYSSSSSTAASASASGWEESRGLKAPQAGSLHSVRKPLSKPWKKPIAPFPPTPPKVYTVDPLNFRDLVQKLTGSPEFMSPSHISTSTTHFEVPHHQRLQRVAPPPLHVSAPPLSRAEVSAPLNMFSGLDHSNHNYSNTSKDTFTSNSLGVNLSPSYNWCTFPILSPGTLASLEQSTVP
ncbi:VQ motif-containing protein 29 [Hibiscus syriacus]|uniref:VQ motif-containing protein 29 n=1 Tax=Hibiscus syriacus TaxID=106335 RepID=A0A6A2Y5S4_HIBSY|nr:VQ motif-containing protein 9-like [Hibiscus syriacus]KAE8671476.1 VQ motif-containing protein 29 [Hibiscus syriacus]